MIVSFDDLRKILTGALSASVEDGGFFPRRFTDAQYELYAKTPAFKTRSLCPAGAALDFVTDSETVTLKISRRDFCRDWAYFDLYVNDIFFDSQGWPSGAEAKTEIKFIIPKKLRTQNGAARLTIYLPYTANLVLKEMALQEGSSLEIPPRPGKRILCLGDSITQGMSAVRASAVYPTQLARFMGMSLLNHGIGGFTFDPESVDPALDFAPDIITEAYGINDWSSFPSAEHFEEKCSGFFARLTSVYKNSKIIAVTPLWNTRTHETTKVGTQDFVAEKIRDICRPYENVTVVNGHEMVPNIPDFFSDGIHPNDLGFMFYAQGLIKTIQRL
jgi:lysophospholipase L1-like esterase